ncbi:MAG: tetratricopeptide repeat protein [Bryobacteraceae bacterium]|nr:tetratricopeptide repeat protein [Bryobacteraceae bacterium]
MAKTLFLLAAIFLLPSAHADEYGQLDYNQILFGVMAAWDASHATAENTPADPLRAAVRKEVLARNPASLKELRSFFFDHRKPDPGADLAQYISFALVSEMPGYQLRVVGIEVPPDVQGLTGFKELMARFHEDAGLDSLWTRVQPQYEQALAQFQPPTAQTVLEANAYLRNPTSGYMGRRFQIFVDLLTPASQVHTRSFKDDYFIVVTPPASSRLDDIRHAYLHYLIDPLATKYYEKFSRIRGLIDYAQAAPALEPIYKDDFLLLGTESLIRAIESRITRQPVRAQEALAEGFVLTPFFADNLPVYEKQDAAMRLYLPEMLDAIDLRKEDKRLRTVQFAKEKTARKAVPVAPPAQPEIAPAEQALNEADKLYGDRNLEGAREAYLKITRQFEDNPTKSRAYYGLARVAALKSEPELAEQLFRKTLELAPDPHTRSWTLVYLGRLAEGYGEKAQAIEHYRSALAIEGAPPGARQAAEQGVQKSAPQ